MEEVLFALLIKEKVPRIHKTLNRPWVWVKDLKGIKRPKRPEIPKIPARFTSTRIAFPSFLYVSVFQPFLSRGTFETLMIM